MDFKQTLTMVDGKRMAVSPYDFNLILRWVLLTR